MRVGSCRFSICIALVITFLAPAALAQGKGGSAGASASSRTSVPPPRTITPDNVNRAVFISGKVLLQGGGVIPEPVPIERVCNGNSSVRREAYTDMKGQFQFQLGATVAFQDASEQDASASAGDSHMGYNQQTRGIGTDTRTAFQNNSCELRAVLAGYLSTSVVLRPNSADSWQYDAGTIFLKRMGDAPGTTISVTSMAAPGNALHAYEKAQKLKEEKPAESLKELQKAVRIYPQFAAAWSLMGDIHRSNNEFDAASDAYEKAIAADPQFVNPNFGLAVIALQQKKYDDVARFSSQVVKLNAAAFPLAYFFHAAANYNLQKYDVAEDSAKKFKALDTQHGHPDVCVLLSYIYSNKQDYVNAAREIREYLVLAPNSPNADALAKEAKRFEDLSVSAKRQ